MKYLASNPITFVKEFCVGGNDFLTESKLSKKHFKGNNYKYVFHDY